MNCFKKKNAGDALASARLFDAETGHFDPTRTGSARFSRIDKRGSWEIASLTPDQISRFCLIPQKLVSCAVQFPVEFRP